MQRITELNLARAELQELRLVRVTLSDTLASHAAQLKSIGALPPEDLLDQLLNYRTRLVRLAANLAITATGIASDSSPTPGLTLDAVQSLIDYREAVERRDATLRKVLRLSHADDAEFAPLSQCREQASLILQTAHTRYDEQLDLAGLNAAMQPFEALLALAQSGNELSDDAWTLYQEQVSARWGRLLSTALARGKIRLALKPQTEEITEGESVQEAESPVEIPSESLEISSVVEQEDSPGVILAPEFNNKALNAAPDDDIDTVFDTQHDMIFDAVGKPGAERSPSRSYRSVDLKLLSAEPYQWTQQDQTWAPETQSPVSTSDSVAELARRALEADPSDRGLHLSQLILQLLWSDRSSMAYHLARSVEEQMANGPFVPPTWLLRTVTLCRNVCYANGEIGRLIERDLEHFQPTLLNSADPVENAAMGLLVRAAALLPALLTSSPAAARIITSFRISPGLSHLYNYCGRILTYGQKLQGQAADLFTPDCDSYRWAAEIARLQQDIEHWLPETVNRYCAAAKSSQFFLTAHWTLIASTSVRHESATRVWGKWQEVFRIVNRLLTSVRAGDQSERNWIKLEVERLTHAVQLESATNSVLERGPVEVLLFPDEAMVTVIREAIDFANRWLRLCAAKPDQGRTLMTREAEILRNEILERTDGVVAELVAYTQAHAAPCIKASIACLCRTIEHLRMIFSPHSTLPLREIPPSQILGCELVDIPHLELNAQGLPTLALNDLEAVLLTHLSGASAEQFDKLEHRVTARILESNVRLREQKQEALKPCRAGEINDSCWD